MGLIGCKAAYVFYFRKKERKKVRCFVFEFSTIGSVEENMNPGCQQNDRRKELKMKNNDMGFK